jgi:RNA binding exosome subunit
MFNTEFYKWLYYWSIQDWEREALQGFPYLNNIGETAAQNVIATLNKSEQSQFFKAMVKRVTNPQLLSEIGEKASYKDKEYQNRYLEQWRLAGLSDPIYKKIDRARRDMVILSDFKQKIVSSLSVILPGNYRDVESEYLWEYQTFMGNSIVLTRIEIGNDNYQLSYSQSILSIYKDPILHHYSILRWLGISSGTEWYGVTNTNVSDVIFVLSNIIVHFISKVRTISKIL